MALSILGPLIPLSWNICYVVLRSPFTRSSVFKRSMNIHVHVYEFAVLNVRFAMVNRWSSRDLYIALVAILCIKEY